MVEDIFKEHQQKAHLLKNLKSRHSNLAVHSHNFFFLFLTQQETKGQKEKQWKHKNETKNKRKEANVTKDYKIGKKQMKKKIIFRKLILKIQEI